MKREAKAVVWRAALVLIICSSTVLAVPKDDGFKTVIRHLESHYKAKRTYIPFLGLANLAVKIVRPAGVKGFRLAVFEDQDFSETAGGIPFDQVVRQAYGSGWQPLVRVYSRRGGGEQTFIYGRPKGSDLKIAIVVLEPREAVLVEATVNTEAAAKYLSKPETIASLKGSSRRENRKNQDQAPQAAPRVTLDREALCNLQ